MEPPDVPRAAQLAFGAWYRSEPGEGAGAVRRLLARPEGAGVAGGHVQEQLATVAGALEALEAGGLLRHGAEALASPARGTGRAVGKWHWDFQPKRAPAGAGGAEEEAARAAQLQSLLEPAALGPAASGSEDEDGEGEAGPMEVEAGSSEEEATEVPAEVPGPAEAEGSTPPPRSSRPDLSLGTWIRFGLPRFFGARLGMGGGHPQGAPKGRREEPGAREESSPEATP